MHNQLSSARFRSGQAKSNALGRYSIQLPVSVLVFRSRPDPGVEGFDLNRGGS